MGHSSDLDDFLNIHRDQLVSSGVPEIYWDTLYRKLINQTFDAGSSFQLLKIDSEDHQEYDPVWALQALRDIEQSNSENIFLIDHAWTFRIEHVKQQLTENQMLRERMCNLLGIDINMPVAEAVNKIFNDMWRINNFYRITSAETPEERLPIWYIMDEIGNAVIHRDEPNCRIVPFIYISDQITYSVLFPVEDIEQDEIIARDYAEGETNDSRRSAILLPWVPTSFEDVDPTPSIPDANYFLSGHIKENLPDLSKLATRATQKDVLNVYSQYDLIKTYLTSNNFDIVDNEDDADILWYTEHFTNFDTLSNTPGRFINQFPFEYVITVKDLLCLTCRRSPESAKWLPISFNLLIELENFISCYNKRQAEGLDNLWIVKPYNLARGLDTHITDNLNYIIRLATTGPKIVQRYITNPVLFHRSECEGKVKFDIRYVLLLKNVKPLEAYVYEKFFLRFANVPFELDDFSNYQKHFTVMNYQENVDLRHIKCDDFIIQFEQQYPDHTWKKIEKVILKMLKDILESATSVDPPCGFAESPQSRALYAADIMLEWNAKKEMEPRILEINFTPDCQRACDYYPDFYDDIFALLFFNENSGKCLPL